MQSHLELKPAAGDETIGRLRFVLRGDTAAAAADISVQGLRFTPGEACVSGSLATAAERAGTAGRVLVLAVPTDFRVGYPVLNTAFISRADLHVIGAPRRYAAARQALSLYRGEDVETERMKIESEVFNGSPLADHPAFTLDYRNVIGGLAVNTQLESVLARLHVSAEALEAVDFTSIDSALTELFECREPAQQVLVPTTVHALAVAEVEAVVIAKLRQLRWQGLATLGYAFKEGKEPVEVAPAADVAAQHQALLGVRKRAEGSALLTGELAWLKTFTLRQLELMRIELDGAELEADER